MVGTELRTAEAGAGEKLVREGGPGSLYGSHVRINSAGSMLGID